MRRVLFTLLFLLFSSASAASAFEPPRLPGITLQRYYRITTFWLDDLSMWSVEKAAENWNRAAQDPSFITWADDPDEAQIWVTSLNIMPMVENGQVWIVNGVALPLGGKRCVIVMNQHARYNVETMTHEIGHCMGLAHHEKDEESIMGPAVPGKTRKIKKNLANWLAEAIKNPAP